MALLTRKVDYALLIMCYLHHKAEGACAREIAGHFALSRPFVANILKDLCHKGFVLGQRGANGGYVLRRSARGITLADLMDALEDSVRLAECNGASPEQCCSLSPTCPVRDPIAEVHNRIRAVLENVTLAEIFDPNRLDLNVSRCVPAT